MEQKQRSLKSRKKKRLEIALFQMGRKPRVEEAGRGRGRNTKRTKMCHPGPTLPSEGRHCALQTQNNKNKK